MAPSKDTYWTTEHQPNSPYVDNPTEPNWQLQALTVALSTGPNGPGDAIGWTRLPVCNNSSQCVADAAAGHTNASLVMSTVRGDGINLQPDRPATVTDGVVCLQMLTSHTHIHSRCDAGALMQTLLGRAPPNVLSAYTAFGCLVWFFV